MKKLSKILVLVLAFAMMFTLASMFTASAAGETKTIYFKPTGSWIQNNEKYAVWSWGGNTGSTWHDLSDVDGDGVYSTDIPYADTTVIFVRMDAGKPTDWSSKWDQTVNISLGSTDLSATYYSNTSSKEGNNFKYSTTAYTPAHICNPEVVEEVPSTCIKPGYQVKVCSDPTCGAEQKVDLPAGHTLVGGTCSVCGFNTAEEHTVYFKNTDNWATVKAYYWGTNNPVEWPGVAITEENGLYAVTLPAGSYNIIFNNQVNDAGPKSVDLVVPAEPMVYNWETKAWEELPHTCNFVAGEVVAPTYTAGGYTVYSCTCGKTENRDLTDKLVPAFPEANVTDISGVQIDDETALTFALNYGIKGVSIVDGNLVLDPEVFSEEYLDAVLATYGDMYVDFRLTINGTVNGVTFNADGTKDGFLSGQYDAWSSSFVSVPFGDDVTLANGESLCIMEYAAELMGQSGLRYTLGEVATIVVDFDCGIYFTPEFLAANPDMVITLELIVFNEDAEGNKLLLNDAPIAKNRFTIPYTNSLVVGENDVKIGNNAVDNGFGYLMETVLFTADEKAHYEFVGEGLTILVYDLSMNNLCGFSGKADLEAGTYIICFAANTTGTMGNYSITVTKSEIVVPEHVNKLVIGENNKIVISGETLNQNDNPIEWVPFVVEEKALYTFASETENALVYIFNSDYSMPGGALTSAAVLEPGNYLICVGNGAIGDIYVTVTKSEVPTECQHVYVYMNCTLCGAVNPDFKHNIMEVGTNNVVCNEYHLVDTTGHGNPYQFTTFTVTEAGVYRFTSDKNVGFTIFTTEINAEGADWTAGTGASWGVFIAGNQAELQPGTYYIGLIFADGVGEYEITLEKVVVEDVPTEPTEPTDPEDPNLFERIWAAILAFLNTIVEFFKGLFVK